MPDDKDIKVRLLKKCNEMRAAKNLSPFKYDARLAEAAQTHADDLAAGRARPHDRLMERIKNSGFPVSMSDCLISRRAMQANFSEGILDAPPSLGIDEKSPEYLTSSGPGEGHYDDFFDPKINHVGIGVSYSTRMDYMVLDYGRICQEEPEPTPEPKPLTPDDFSSF
jgi:uncharacterized protein YkwD